MSVLKFGAYFLKVVLHTSLNDNFAPKCIVTSMRAITIFSLTACHGCRGSSGSRV